MAFGHIRIESNPLVGFLTFCVCFWRMSVNHKLQKWKSFSSGTLSSAWDTIGGLANINIYWTNECAYLPLGCLSSLKICSENCIILGWYVVVIKDIVMPGACWREINKVDLWSKWKLHLFLDFCYVSLDLLWSYLIVSCDHCICSKFFREKLFTWRCVNSIVDFRFAFIFKTCFACS